jgi:glycosyltransferase involved in cell wall biosynthesis
MFIAILGTRGIPARHGGFETCVEETSTRLAARGHHVRVYCRKERGEQPATYRGVALAYVPQPDNKYLHTLGHTFRAARHLARHPLPAPPVSLILVDNPLSTTSGRGVVHLYNVGNAILIPLIHRSGYRVAISVDALDWARSKWNRVARAYLQLAERCAVRFADCVIVDSKVIAGYYARRYGRETAYVAYGADTTEVTEDDLVRSYGLEPGRYVLFVGRLKPEKQVHHLLEAYRGLETDIPLAIVGDDPFSQDYIRQLKAMADERVRFLGYAYDRAFRQLCAHAALYVTPSAVEGTSPALLGAMGAGACVLVNGIPENLETIGDAGFSYAPNDPADLRRQLARLLASPELRRQTGQRARERVRAVYNWERITDQLEAIYEALQYSGLKHSGLKHSGLKHSGLKPLLRPGYNDGRRPTDGEPSAVIRHPSSR